MYTKQKKSPSTARLVDYLKQAGIRATRQRLALAALLFDGTHKHMTAEQVRSLMSRRKVPISLATIYNSLHQFTKAGLLQEVSVDPNGIYFDTNCDAHYHCFDEPTRVLTDVSASKVRISGLPRPPDGRSVRAIDIIVRMGRKKA